MIRAHTLTALLALTTWPAWADGPKVANAEDAKCTGEFGTSLHFEKTPSEAARKALKEEKLVIVLHVSGDFEDPAFT